MTKTQEIEKLSAIIKTQEIEKLSAIIKTHKKMIDDAEENNSRLRQLLRESRAETEKSNADILKLEYRLDACLYAMVLMQSQVRTVEKENKNYKVNMNGVESVWVKDKVKLAT